MSFFANAHNTIISAHNVTMNAYSSSRTSDRGTLGSFQGKCRRMLRTYEGFDILCQNTTPTALYGSDHFESSKDPGCLHGTRLDVQDHIVRWLDNPESGGVMWMYGPAGIGKTAIAQTVARLCEERGQLSSAFFFFRSDEGRNSGKHLVPTLAFEMLQQMPYTRDIVCTPIANNPLIFSTPLQRQIRAILLPALSTPLPVPQGISHGPMLLIIDGLDECTDTGMQKFIIQSFVSLFTTTATAIRHKILVVSRPESHIVSTFAAVNISRHVSHLCLDEWKSIADIEIFLRAELEEVKQTHPLKSYLDVQWPSEYLFRKFLNKCFESFAYATSAMRYISSHDRHPEISLNNLLGLSPDFAYEAHAELDSLYRHILDSLDEKTRHTALKVLCLYSMRSLDLETFASTLGEEFSTVELAIIKLSSVIRLQGTHISYYHTSFSDFLLDKQRSGPLYLYSSSVGSAVANALVSSLWVTRPTIPDEDSSHLSTTGPMRNNLLPALVIDIQTHVLNVFLATRLPTISSVFLNPRLGDFFGRIDEESQSDGHSEKLKLLFCQAFEHLASWLRSQVGAGTRTSETILEICFPPAVGLPSNTQVSSDLCTIICNFVRGSKDPWSTICRLLPAEETSQMCIALLKIYLSVPPDVRSEDTMKRHIIEKNFSYTITQKMSPLTTILTRVLQSEPTHAEVCHALEQIVLQAITASPKQRTPPDLISYYLSRDTREPATVPNAQELNPSYALIAQSIDSYIRRTHAELNLPYVAEDVRKLYCDALDV